MDHSKTNRISILNNNDSPSFSVPRSSPKSHDSFSSDQKYQSQTGSRHMEDDLDRRQLILEATPTVGRTFPHEVQTSLSVQPPTHLPSQQSSLGDPKSHKSNKKNKYPCPYAVSHSCSATFTTSGHAARHGKTHTGEKSVHCPVCNKAFTRKDNMKQHQRTHRRADKESNICSENDWPTGPSGTVDPYAVSNVGVELSSTSMVSKPSVG